MGNLSRYSCQIVLPGFGAVAQQKLQAAKVLIAGAGGLGCPVAQYLTAAGVGHLTIADNDVISLSNLHRQILYMPDEVGMKKSTVAAARLQQQNPGITITGLDCRIGSENVLSLISQCDLVIDTTDNITTKYLLNDACVMAGKPCVYGAVYQYEGQAAVWNVCNEDGSYSANYRDVFPNIGPGTLPSCADGGIIPTLTGVIGSLMANETIKYFTGIGDTLHSRLFIIDAATMQTRIIQLPVQTQTHITTIKNSTPLITAAELLAGLQSDSFTLIDVRTAKERSVFHIGGQHIPLSLLAHQLTDPGERPVVCYCASGQRSAEAAAMIKDKFPGTIVYSLSGGLNSWNNE